MTLLKPLDFIGLKDSLVVILKWKINLNETINKWINKYRTDGMSEHKNSPQGWRDGSVVKSIFCSSRGPCFKSQLPHGGSKLPVTPVLGDFHFHGIPVTNIVHKHTYGQNTRIHKIK